MTMNHRRGPQNNRGPRDPNAGYRNRDYTPEPVEKDASAVEALDLAKSIREALTDLPEHVKDKASEFFTSVGSKAKSIAATIERSGTASDGQITALSNMLKGVRRWTHDDEEED